FFLFQAEDGIRDDLVTGVQTCALPIFPESCRDALTGDVGFTDVDDVTAGLRDLLGRPDVDPSRTVIAGWSWGGYITLMELGRYRSEERRVGKRRRSRRVEEQSEQRQRR